MNQLELLELTKFSKSLKILYVEDSDEARVSTLKMFDNFFTDITVAIDGEDGLKKFKEGCFSLIISDINMPKMDGTEMVHKIREIDKDVKVLILSAFSEQNKIDSFKGLNIEGYLLKPVALDQFLEIISKIVNKMR